MKISHYLALAAIIIAMGVGVASCTATGGNYDVNYYNRGKTTANGDSFEFKAFTCAVATESMMNHWYRFEYKGRAVYAYANDRIGPKGIAKGHKYELTEGAFRHLLRGKDPQEYGVLTVGVSLVE